MLALRLMGAVHRLVLAGAAPALAAQFPSAGGEPLRALAGLHRDGRGPRAASCANWSTDPVQTNETARCTALLGGFLEVARLTGLPLRLLEVGASAGLNLRFDRYRYELGERTWGPPGAEPVLRAALSGGRRRSAPSSRWRRGRAATRAPSIRRPTRACSPCPHTCGPTRSRGWTGCGRPAGSRCRRTPRSSRRVPSHGRASGWPTRRRARRRWSTTRSSCSTSRSRSGRASAPPCARRASGPRRRLRWRG